MRTVLLILLLLAGCSVPTTDRPAPVPLPHARHGHRIERLDGGYLCFGGFADATAADRGARDVLWLADDVDAWSSRSSTSDRHAFFGSGVHDGAAVAIGPSVESYDIAQDTWRQRTPVDATLPRSHFGAAVIEQTAWILGGFPQVGTGFHAVDLTTGGVVAYPPPPTFAHGDHFHVLCALAGELHVVGGLRGKDSEILREHWVRRAGAWLRLADAPRGIWAKFTAVAVHRDSLFLFGDAHGRESLHYDPARACWRELAPPPAIVAMPAAVPTDEAIWIVGGMAVDGPVNIFWRYDIATDAWNATPRRRRGDARPRG